MIEWEYGETGFESQFDEEGRVRGMAADGSVRARTKHAVRG